MVALRGRGDDRGDRCRHLWLLDFVHVFSSLLWTGIDLFMGFVLGPILRRVGLPVRREIMRG